jgi:hypothetical protein
MSRGFFRPLEIELIRQETREIADRQRKAGRHGEAYPSGPDAGLLRIKTANDWLKSEYGKPQARRLFGDFWFENELCILFADTNRGKSVLAVQIGESLSKAYCIEPFANGADECARVLYIDFELTAQQFANRYSDQKYGNHDFGHYFYRAEFNPAANDPALYSNYHTFVHQAMENAVLQTKPAILIIDNLTCLGGNTGYADSAIALIRDIRKLQVKHNLSVLVLAHTPKRNHLKPITTNDLQGSKMLMNFCDSAFAIGLSHTRPGYCYLKQIKQRSGAQAYGENNVCLGKIIKNMSMLRFEFDGYAQEAEHLQTSKNYEELNGRIEELGRKGQSCRQIAAKLGCSHTHVNRVLQRVKEES